VTVAVVTDSAASIPPELAAERGVVVVPLHLMVGSGTTSSPSPGEFLTAAERAGGDAVVILTVSSRVSGVWNAARLAADSARMPVTVVDTETAAGAQALVVLAAADAATAGADAAGVEAAARTAIDGVRLVAVVDGLDHLVRSGRVPGIAGWAGRMLGLQPLFEFRHGAARRLRPATSREAALTRIFGHWRRSHARVGPDHHLHVVGLHASAESDAEALGKRVREELAPAVPATDLILEFSPVMVAHTGPGLVGLAWRWEQAR
jgi:DegV family protein with EDD domain